MEYPSTCVRVLVYHFMNRSQISAQYTPRTLLFVIWLNKVGPGKKLPKLYKKCYKVSWCLKMTATQYSTISLSVQRLKEYSFTLFHHVFWKTAVVSGVFLSGFLGFLVPKMHWDVKKMRGKKNFNGKPNWPFPVEICEPTLWRYERAKPLSSLSSSSS